MRCQKKATSECHASHVVYYVPRAAFVNNMLKVRLQTWSVSSTGLPCRNVAFPLYLREYFVDAIDVTGDID